MLLRVKAPFGTLKSILGTPKKDPQPQKVLSEPSHLQSLWEQGGTQGLKPTLSLMYPLDDFGV